MFTMRQQHLAGLEAQLQNRVRRQVRRCVEKEHAIALDEEANAGQASIVEEAITRAWAYGIHRVEDVQDFADLALEHGVQFEQLPENRWMADILQSTEMDGEEKITRILQGLQGEEDEPENLDGETEEAGEDDVEKGNRETNDVEPDELESIDHEADETDPRRLLGFADTDE